MLLCKNCGNQWPETVPKAVPPKHCPKCGAPAVVRTDWPEQPTRQTPTVR